MNVFFTLILLIFTVRIGAIRTCYHPGPAFPPVNRILNRTHLDQLGTKLDDIIEKALSNPDKWTTNTTSFAVQLTSSDETIWSHYYTAPILGEYKDSEPTDVGGDTAFRIASISKSFTVYAILLEKGINLEDPITKYVPELLERDDDDSRRMTDLLVEWDQITIRSLASQLSGIARETGLGELSADLNRLPDPIGSGFPPIDEESLAPCSKNTTDKPCSALDIVRTARIRYRVFAPNDRSTYSNVAFSLLGMVLERVTGRSYSEVIDHSILDPLGMSHTRISKPKDSAGIIPFGPNDWAVDLDADTPSGGIYSTPNDLSRYLRSILSSALLPANTTNAWMKPHSWTSSGTNSAYGMPWEMLRTTKGTPDGRPIDIITKGGSLTGYFSTIALLPEFGLGLTILVAGASPALSDLLERVSAGLIPSVDALLRDEVRRTYCGSYAALDEDDWFGPLDKDWSFRIEVDDSGPGLRIHDWKSNGIHFLPVYGKLKGMAPDHPEQWEARLLPTGIHWPFDGGDDPGESETWRLTAIPSRDDDSNNEVGDRIWDDYCMTDVDALMYGGYSVEEFMISKVAIDDDDHENGRLQAGIVSLTGLRTLLLKWEDCDGRRLVVSGRSRLSPMNFPGSEAGKFGYGSGGSSSSLAQKPISK